MNTTWISVFTYIPRRDESRLFLCFADIQCSFVEIAIYRVLI